jgi:hypothetical protein
VGRYRVILEAHHLGPDARLFWMENGQRYEPGAIESVTEIPEGEQVDPWQPRMTAVEVCPCGHALTWHNTDGCHFEYGDHKAAPVFAQRRCKCQLQVEYVDADA